MRPSRSSRPYSTREALSLLYRGALSRAVIAMARDRRSFTEGEALRAMNAHSIRLRAAYLADLVGVWQRTVYAGETGARGKRSSVCATAFAPALEWSGGMRRERIAARPIGATLIGLIALGRDPYLLGGITREIPTRGEAARNPHYTLGVWQEASAFARARSRRCASAARLVAARQRAEDDFTHQRISRSKRGSSRAGGS